MQCCGSEPYSRIRPKRTDPNSVEEIFISKQKEVIYIIIFIYSQSTIQLPSIFRNYLMRKHRIRNYYKIFLYLL